MIFTIGALGVWFVGRYVPETKDRQFEQLDADPQARWVREPPAVAEERY